MKSTLKILLATAIFSIFNLQFSICAAQTIKGTLTDEATGEAIPFANVVLDGTRYGAASDLNGFFLINKFPAGTYTLRVRFLGYEEFTETLTIAKGQTLTRNIKLKSSATTLKTVIITDNRVEERKLQTQVSVEKITSTQIQQMPSIGGQADLAQYLQVLPGINSTGDQGGQLYIRGGSMIQNLTLLDGMVVYNPFHSIGLYSIFETDIILNADVYSGGFGAEYGGRISSVMDITTRDGNKKRHSGKIGLNTFGASLMLEGPLKKENANSPLTITYLLSAKNSYLSKTSTVLYPHIEGGLPFDFLDLYGKLSINSGSGSKINFFGFRFDDVVNGYQALDNYHWRNYGAGTNFMLVTGSSSILEGNIAYSDYTINLEDASKLDKYSSINGFNVGLAITNFIGTNRLRYGLSMEGYSTDYQYYNALGIATRQKENTNNISAYATYKMNLGNWLIDPGLRYQYYISLASGSLEPRLAVKYNATDNFRFKAAGGLYSQIFLDARSDNDIVNLFNGFLTGSGTLNKPHTFLGNEITNCVQRAWHAILGVEYDFTQHLTADAEVYFKDFTQLLNSNRNKLYDRTDPAYGSDGPYAKPEYYLTDYIIESGMAYGVDFSLCFDIERLYLWATYSLGWVTRTDEVQTYTPHYDRRHTVNLLASYYLGEERQWEISGRWSYGSGFPYTQTQGMYENLPFSSGITTDYTLENGTYGVAYGELYAGRLPSYHRLDLSIKRKFSIGKRSLLELNLGATNVYNRNNIFYIERLTLERVDQLPILVSGGLSFSF
ncbi:MAG: TonB-dependent receptor [Bacteroidales bacterium]|nr:TonB-dependent receptor [Bacteroidales bacterium]